MTFAAGLGALPWAAWAVALPLAAATAVWLARRLPASLGVTLSLVMAGVVAALGWQVWTLGPQRHAVGGWGAPLGIDLYADGLSVVMLAMTAAIGVAVTVYAGSYFEGTASLFWPLWFFLWAALNALFLSGDVFNLYVTLELVTLAAVGLVTLAGGTTAASAALRYLLAALLGSLLYLLGVAVLYAVHGTLDVASLGRVIAPGAMATVALSAITIGLALKSALFPLHFWLPGAHASAPAPVSALLSGLVVKASFYLLLRLWFDAFPAAVSAGGGTLVALLGAGAIVWGSIQAIAARRLKELVAYSTVAQLGYLFLVFALAPAGERGAAWSGAVLFAVSHACAKAAMFLAAGSLLRVAGHDRIAELGGVGRRLPITFFALALAGVALMGLPPSGTFVAKWLLLEAAIDGGRLWLAAVILAGGLLAAVYLFRILGQAFTTSEDDVPLFVPRRMDWAALVLAVAAASLGFASAPILALLRVTS